MDLGKHRVYTHFPKDRNCQICQRTKITRAPCRRRTSEVVPRAEKFGDLITADHRVLNEEGESRNNHRYAVVVQDLFNLIRAQTTSQETEKSLRKFLEPSQKPNVNYTDNSSEFGKSCAELSWNHQRQHLIDLRRMVLLTGLYDEKKNEHQQYCCNPAWTKMVG